MKTFKQFLFERQMSSSNTDLDCYLNEGILDKIASKVGTIKKSVLNNEQEVDKSYVLRDFVRNGKELPAIVERDFKRNFAYIFGKNSVAIDRLRTKDFYDDITAESVKRGKEIVMRFTYNGSKLRKVYNTRNPQIYLDQDEFEKFFANACKEYNGSEAVNKLNRHGMKKIFLVPGSEYSEYGLSYEYSMIKTKALDVAEGHFECIIKIEITDDRF